MRRQTFQLLREFSVDGIHVAWEALDPSGARVTIWPGSPEYVPSNTHPTLPNAIGSGQLDGAAVWIEHRPGSIVLEDIMLRVSVADGIQWIAQLCDAVTALHAIGRTHGNITAKHVLLSPSGKPYLIGTGQREGRVATDLEALIVLAKKLAPLASLTSEDHSAASLAAKLRETLAMLPEKTPVQLPPPAERTPIRSSDIELMPLGPMDEVHVDVGADTGASGLLDRWDHFDPEDEFTEDATESVDRSMLQTHNPDAIAASLDQQFESILETANNQGISPDEDYRQLVLTAPTDPLPIPEGLPHGPLHNPEGDAERTAEVPASAHPVNIDVHEETTGLTNTAAIPPLYLTGLLTAAITGMLGAIIMLIVVWLIIGGAY